MSRAINKNKTKKQIGNRKAGSRTQNKGNLVSLMEERERTEHPPQIDSYQVIHSTRLRFTITAARLNQSITFQNLLDAMLVATSATAGFQLFDVVKVKLVEIWGQAALGTPSTVEVAYNTATGDASVHTDTSLGIRPAYVSARPSIKSLASFFSVSSANPVFQLTAPAGSIIDVHLLYKTSIQAPVPLQNALVAATLGEFYFRGLDGLAVAASNFVPPAGVLIQ
jgi:hypothetical protein